MRGHERVVSALHSLGADVNVRGRGNARLCRGG
jgi:hypothetical protein